MRSQGFTLIEVIIVAAILAILAGAVFVLSGPARENARQAICMTQLKQIHASALLYATDWPENSGLPYLDDFPVSGFRPNTLASYTKSKDTFYCPDSTQSARKRFPSTYSWRIGGFTLGPIKDEFDALHNRKLRAELERDKTSFAILACEVHDEVYYMPREMDNERLLEQRFKLLLALDGSVRKARVKQTRTIIFP